MLYNILFAKNFKVYIFFSNKKYIYASALIWKQRKTSVCRDIAFQPFRIGIFPRTTQKLKKHITNKVLRLKQTHG